MVGISSHSENDLYLVRSNERHQDVPIEQEISSILSENVMDDLFNTVNNTAHKLAWTHSISTHKKAADRFQALFINSSASCYYFMNLSCPPIYVLFCFSDISQPKCLALSSSHLSLITSLISSIALTKSFISSITCTEVVVTGPKCMSLLSVSKMGLTLKHRATFGSHYCAETGSCFGWVQTL